MLNAEHGTNLTDANVTGTYNNGTAANLLINATGLTAGQFNSFQPGRYSSYGGQFLLGFGMADTEPFNDPVMRDGLADHSWRILRGQNWQVNESRGVGTITK
jgi:hypothetical protein